MNQAGPLGIFTRLAENLQRWHRREEEVCSLTRQGCCSIRSSNGSRWGVRGRSSLEKPETDTPEMTSLIHPCRCSGRNGIPRVRPVRPWLQPFVCCARPSCPESITIRAADTSLVWEGGHLRALFCQISKTPAPEFEVRLKDSLVALPFHQKGP